MCLQRKGLMPGRLYEDDPLTPVEREDFEEGLISFCDRELDLLGDISGLDVLYAGGASPLWLEGLSQRIGDGGSLTALEAGTEHLQAVEEALLDAELTAPVRLVAGDVFGPPSGFLTSALPSPACLFQELNVRERPLGTPLGPFAAI